MLIIIEHSYVGGYPFHEKCSSFVDQWAIDESLQWNKITGTVYTLLVEM